MVQNVHNLVRGEVEDLLSIATQYFLTWRSFFAIKLTPMEQCLVKLH